MPDADEDLRPAFEQHAFLVGRCIRCGTDNIDADVNDGLGGCPGKADDKPIAYTTSTGVPPVASHGIAC